MFAVEDQGNVPGDRYVTQPTRFILRIAYPFSLTPPLSGLDGRRQPGSGAPRGLPPPGVAVELGWGLPLGTGSSIHQRRPPVGGRLSPLSPP